MRNISLQWKLTIWFSIALILMAALTFTVVFFVSHAVLRNQVQTELIHTVEDNVDEVEYCKSISPDEMENSTDIYISYDNGYLEIDDDFLSNVDGVTTALYDENGVLLYGEDPITNDEPLPFEDGTCRILSISNMTYHVFDRHLQQDQLQELWLRGAVPELKLDTLLHSIVRICIWGLIGLTVFSILGGVLIARRALKPVRNMAFTASQISKGSDLKKRMPVNGQDELAQLADAFNGMMQRLDASFEAERQFTSDASHELRTPMAVIMAQCDDVLSGERTAAEYREALLVIQRQGKRMSRLISGMLELLRMERKAEQYEKELLDLSILTESVTEDMATLREKDIALTADIEPDIMMHGDPVLLTRLLTNLISNAYRYGRRNGHIRVCLRRRNDCVELSVADDGIGIPADQQEKIFHRLYQGTPDRSGEGTGLGLAMARQIAQMHGGTLQVESTEGMGSTFTASFRQ